MTVARKMPKTKKGPTQKSAKRKFQPHDSDVTHKKTRSVEPTPRTDVEACQ
jgi:hypothetical protein